MLLTNDELNIMQDLLAYGDRSNMIVTPQQILQQLLEHNQDITTTRLLIHNNKLQSQFYEIHNIMNGK